MAKLHDKFVDNDGRNQRNQVYYELTNVNWIAAILINFLIQLCPVQGKIFLVLNLAQCSLLSTILDEFFEAVVDQFYDLAEWNGAVFENSPTVSDIEHLHPEESLVHERKGNIFLRGSVRRYLTVEVLLSPALWPCKIIYLLVNMTISVEVDKFVFEDPYEPYLAKVEDYSQNQLLVNCLRD